MIKNKYFLMATVAVFAVSAVFATKNNEKSPPSGHPGKIHVVKLNDDGFNPKELTIYEGDTVNFVTTRKNYFWPASNLHPTHDIYPEFDPQEPLAPEESWGFKFDKPGEWKYHDHLAPYFTGIIRVLQEGAAGFKGGCEDNTDSLECFQENLFLILNEKGVEAVFDALAGFYVTEPRLPPACHFITHNIGLEAYRLFLKDKDSVISPKTIVCASGFFHGFMESFLTADYNVKKAREFCAYVGEKIGKDAPDAELQCYHGIGHGAMDVAIVNKDLWGSDKKMSEAALKFCEEASEKEEELYRCASGVFNAIANFYITGEYNIIADPLDPLRLCREQPASYKESCYGNMNSILFVPSKDKSILPSAKYIEDITEDIYAIPAIRYLAGLAALYVAKTEPAKGVADCRSLQARLYVPCIEGLAHGLLEHGTPHKEYEDALFFCRGEYLNKEERDVCFRYVATNLQGWYSPEKVRSVCAGIEKEYQEYCSR